MKKFIAVGLACLFLTSATCYAGTIYACKKMTGGTIRIVRASTTCLSTEKKIAWSSVADFAALRTRVDVHETEITDLQELMKQDSYIFVPASSFVRNTQTDTTQWDIQASGAVLFRRGASVGTKTVYFPITLPGVLYGQPTTIKQITVYYKCSNAASYIDYMDLNLQTDAASWLSVIEDGTNLTSTTASNHTLTPSTNNMLSADQGILGFYMYLAFANESDTIEIGGIRLRIGRQ